MNELAKILLSIAALGISTLFAAFLFILNAYKDEIWSEIYRRLK